MAIAKETCYVTPVAMTKDRSEVLQGTLDLMVLKTLDALGPLHGYGIARRLEQISADRLRLNEGTVYNSLLRLVQQGWISSEWGASDSNRKAKFYSITKTGRKQLARETESWQRISEIYGEDVQQEVSSATSAKEYYHSGVLAVRPRAWWSAFSAPVRSAPFSSNDWSEESRQVRTASDRI